VQLPGLDPVIEGAAADPKRVASWLLALLEFRPATHLCNLRAPPTARYALPLLNDGGTMQAADGQRVRCNTLTMSAQVPRYIRHSDQPKSAEREGDGTCATSAKRGSAILRLCRDRIL
jgi:hypothetical protein